MGEVIDLNSYRRSQKRYYPHETNRKAIERFRDNFEGIDIYLHDVINDYFSVAENNGRPFMSRFRSNVYDAFHQAASMPTTQKIKYATRFSSGFESMLFHGDATVQDRFDMRRLGYVRTIVEERFVSAIARQKQEGKRIGVDDYRSWAENLLQKTTSIQSEHSSIAETLRHLVNHQAYYDSICQPRRYASWVAHNMALRFAIDKTGISRKANEAELSHKLARYDQLQFMNEVEAGLSAPQLMQLAGSATMYEDIESFYYEKCVQDDGTLSPIS